MVLEEVRKNVGPWFPIIVRISAEERVPGGNTLEDTLEYLEYLDEFVDMYDVSCGLNPSLQYQIDSNFLPDGWRSYMARAVKDKFKKPVINAVTIVIRRSLRKFSKVGMWTSSEWDVV